MSDLLLEIGTEEIPAGFISGALRQLEEELTRALGDARPQALGPGVAAAFDAAGNPTPAALGFARSQGVEVSALTRVATPKGERLAAEKVEKGRRAEAVLPALLEGLLARLRFRKAMRWGDETVTFARPVRWMTALFGGKPVKIRYGDVRSGVVTYGHRFMAPKAI